MIFEPTPPPVEPPLVVEVFHGSPDTGRFVPTSRVRLGTGIRQLAAAIPPECFRDVIVIASFATANGRVQASARDIVRALGIPAWLGRLRLLRLSRTTWGGQPLVRCHRTAAGHVTYGLSEALLWLRQELPPAVPVGTAPAGREQVIAASRKAYARPREAVEREINALAGWPDRAEMEEAAASAPQKPADLEGRWAVERLAKAGVDYSLGIKLVREYGAERCLKQVRWIEYRNVKNRARYLVAAIRGDYQQPPNFPNDGSTYSSE